MRKIKEAAYMKMFDYCIRKINMEFNFSILVLNKKKRHEIGFREKTIPCPKEMGNKMYYTLY